MRHAAIPLLALLAALPARAGDWNSDAEVAAKRWYEERLKEEKPGLELESLNPVVLRGTGADLVAPHVRFFEARAVKNRDGQFDWDARRIAVKRDLKPWRWEGSVEDLCAVLADCGVKATDEKGMNAAAMAVLAVSDGPAFDPARVEIRGRTLTYHDHRAVGYFGCGFAGWWYGDATMRFDASGRLESFDAGKADMKFDEYRQKRKSGDRWFVDEVQDGEAFAKSADEREKHVEDVLAALVGGDAGKAAAAEQEVRRWGAGAEALLANLEKGASPAAAARLARLRRGWAPDWAKDADEEARRAYEALPAEDYDSWTLREFARIELTGAAEPLAGAWRLYRADSDSGLGTHAKHDLVLCAKDGSVMVWKGELAQAREVLDRAWLRGGGGEGTARAVAALQALPQSAWRTTKVEAVETERIEVRGRDAIWHEHRMWLGSGVLGGYTEDIEYKFGEDGLLAEIRVTGSETFDVREMERLLAEADPWMKLEGWVPERMAASLKKAQAKKEKSPPRHGEPK